MWGEVIETRSLYEKVILQAEIFCRLNPNFLLFWLLQSAKFLHSGRCMLKIRQLLTQTSNS